MEEMQMVDLVERLNAAAGALELAVAKMSERQESLVVEAQETVDRIVATVESAREAELEKKLAEAEAKIAELSAGGFVGGRKTLAAGVPVLGGCLRRMGRWGRAWMRGRSMWR